MTESAERQVIINKDGQHGLSIASSNVSDSKQGVEALKDICFGSVSLLCIHCVSYFSDLNLR